MPRTAPLLAALALAAAAAAQPAIGPDETAEAFITRWNEWAERTDPDRGVIRAIADANAEIDKITERHLDITGYGHWVLGDPTAPGYWPHARSMIRVMAPHTRRIRQALASPHAAVRFPTRAELLEEAQLAPEDVEDDKHHEHGPFDHTEMIHIGRFDEATRSLRTAAQNLSYEATFAIENSGDLAKVPENIEGILDASRLIAERREALEAFYAVALEGLALGLIERTLVRHGVRSRDGALLRLQNALVEHEPHRASFSRDQALLDRANTELLAAWFEPDQSERLTARGRAWYESYADIIEHERNLGWRHHRLHPTNLPPPDAEFAPAAEQIRVYQSLADTFARDAAREPHAIEELESERLFRTLIESDPEGRLAPALTLFYLHDSRLGIDLRTDMRFRAALTILAVYRHHARTGAWPESLADIDPEIMRFDPTDPHSGEPFGYAVIDDQPTLWSAGPDRKNDDGRPIPEPPAPPEGELPRIPEQRWFTLNEWNALPPEARAEYDGDIILYPPQN